MSGVLSFKFAAEELDQEKREVAEQAQPAEVGSLLFQSREGTRLDYVTNAREHGIKWFSRDGLQRHLRVRRHVGVHLLPLPALWVLAPHQLLRLPHLPPLPHARAVGSTTFNLVCFLAHTRPVLPVHHLVQRRPLRG